MPALPSRLQRRPQPERPKIRSKWQDFDDWIDRSELGSDASERLRGAFLGCGADVEPLPESDAEDE